MVGFQTKSPSFLYTVMAISFVVASVLSVYPLSFQLVWGRPMWLVLVLIFWLIFQPTMAGVWLAFWVGLVADLLTDSRMGQQAFCAILVAFFVKFISGYVKQLSSTLVWLLAFACLLLYQSCLIFLHFLTQNIFAPQLLIAVVISGIIWPLLVWVLARFIR